MQTHITTDLVLVGGGHSHLSVIKHFAMQQLPGLRITVISQDIHTPYSGMLPGLIAGHYEHDDAHIDLRPLCQMAKVRLFHSSVRKIDLEQQLIYCNNRAPVRFDYLSMNTGSQPSLASIPGASQTGVAVKPINTFLQHWHQVLESLKKNPQHTKIAIVGGGAASVEVALSIQYQIQKALHSEINTIGIDLLCATPTILNTHNRSVQKTFAKLLRDRKISVKTSCRVLSAQNHTSAIDKTSITNKTMLQLSNNEIETYDQVIWAIHAGSAEWIRHTGISCDSNGFINVNQALQSISHPQVFAAGDIANFTERTLAKSGVYAVRAGKTLALNLHHIVLGKKLKHYRPQKRFLSLLMTGNKSAVASKGVFSTSGEWVWRWKNSVDKKFITQFSPPPLTSDMQTNTLDVSTNKAKDTTATDQALMRCGGCGAKVNHRVLSRVLTKLKPLTNTDVIIGLNSPDDAAVIVPPLGKKWVQTVDYFRTFIDDPYLMGRIASNHCLSDIYAMGAKPHSALAIATIPYGSEAIIEDTLLQLMSGAIDNLNEQQTALIGGHSSEGAELGFGLSVNGVIDHEPVLSAGKLAIGQALILTKPLGTGILFAANAMGNAQGRWVDQAIEHMLISNRQASDIFYQHGVMACTDVTGFGLIGHLLAMLKSSGLGAQLYLDSLPLLNGAVDCAQRGWLSSLYADNAQAQYAVFNHKTFAMDPHYPLLFDPQTAGGLLASVPVEQAEQCLSALRGADCPQAAIIGTIDAGTHNALISLLHR